MSNCVYCGLHTDEINFNERSMGAHALLCRSFADERTKFAESYFAENITKAVVVNGKHIVDRRRNRRAGDKLTAESVKVER